MPGLIGQHVGRYHILELLGEGGMATVYKAHDPRLDREVAIKVIRRDAFPLEDMEMLLKRFEREAKALGKLSHPNIVGVIDYGEHEGSPYLVMVYVPGGTLKDRLGSPMPWQDAIRLLIPIARALEYVHERNIINRDVKPANVLMTEDGQPMLSDFGLAKLFEKDKESTNITGSGAGIGTPDYMAPEQWTGESTALSDLYSLGVVLYEMITGHRPYTADTPAGVLLKQATESLPLPKTYIPHLPQNVESVLLKALAKDPNDRYSNVKAFVADLENLQAGRVVDATNTTPEQLRAQMTGKMPRPASFHAPAPAPAKKAWPVLLAGCAVLALIGAAGGFWLLSGNSGLFAAPSATLTVTQPATVAPSQTVIPFTETSLPPALPTETLVPTLTPFPNEIVDSKNVPMRLIPGGEFLMGSDTADADARPANKVTLAAFYIDKFEVTNERYDACAYARECRRPLQSGSATRISYYGNPVFANYPVIYVDWKMAKAYCEWRGARLPTEAEWEMAARGTDGRSYPWGEEVDCSLANASGCVGDTTPVDQYTKGQSIYGVFDMAGNVLEWTSSLFKFYPYVASDGREDLTAPGDRMARGGSWHDFGGNGGNVRTDTRLKLSPAYYGAYVGFRCALTK
jgi:formylglycine-generating enzyme required for sulfatase activity/tRNA A-37 threonylcarbamoyl transferase component Bud32